MTSLPLVSVIIPTLNRQAPLLHTVSLLASDSYSKTEILIIDQSRPQLAPSLFRAFKKVRLIPQKIQSLPVARNHGLAEAKGQLILFLDDDLDFQPGLIEKHVRLHREHPDTAAITGRIKLEPPHAYPDISQVTQLNLDTAEYKMNFDLDQGMLSDFHSGGHVSFKLEAIRSTGLFDPVFKGNALFEEVDYGLRLRSKGFAILYTPAVEVLHFRHHTGGCRNETNRAYLYNKFFNTAYFFSKHLLKGFPLAFLRAMKKEMEFYSRTQSGHSIIKVAVFSIGLGMGFCRGLWKRWFSE
jgi:GT2 family glycosyltransferase